MKKEELELRIVSYINSLVDEMFPLNSIPNKLKNGTAKFWIKQNTWRLDEIVSVFCDHEGNIEPKEVIQAYEMALFEDGDFCVDPKQVIPDNMDYLKSMVPDKIVVFKKDDLYKLLGCRQGTDSDYALAIAASHENHA